MSPSLIMSTNVYKLFICQ